MTDKGPNVQNIKRLKLSRVKFLKEFDEKRQRAALVRTQYTGIAYQVSQ